MHISEIILILLVALLVIKPERLPEVALKLGRCIKWMQSCASRVKNQLKNAVVDE